jgi:hypothetical protein
MKYWNFGQNNPLRGGGAELRTMPAIIWTELGPWRIVNGYFTQKAVFTATSRSYF